MGWELEIGGTRPCGHSRPGIIPEAKVAPRPARPSILCGPIVTRRALASPSILVFDSGLGGLSVFRELVRARPDARFVYAADDAVFPYGAIEERAPAARASGVMEPLTARTNPAPVLVPPNPASPVILPALRAPFPVPFVGTVPAIKPACAASTTKLVSVLGTEATVKREYTRAL